MAKPEDIFELLPVNVDSTMMGCFRNCPQKFYNEFILGLRPMETSIDLHAGACFAKARETFNIAYHTTCADLGDRERLDKARSLAHQAYSIAWGDVEAPHDSPKTYDNVWEAFEQFLRTYPPKTDHVQPYFIEGIPTFEHRFAIPLDPAWGFPLHPVTKEPFIYSGRFDMLGTWHNRPCVEDDKTTKSAGAKWGDQWSLRSQFIGYVWACQREGITNLDTVVIRGIVIQKTGLRQLESVKHYPAHVVERWLERLRYDLRLLVGSWNTRYWPHDYGDNCSRYGSCAFTDLCYAKDENVAALRTSYIIKRWDPLAQDPTEPQPEVILPQ